MFRWISVQWIYNILWKGYRMSKKVCIIGGETHLGEITGCIGQGMDLVAVCVKEELYLQHFAKYNVPNYANEDDLLANQE